MKRILIVLVIAALVSSASLALLAFSSIPPEEDPEETGGFYIEGIDDYYFSPHPDHSETTWEASDSSLTVDGTTYTYTYTSEDSSDVLEVVSDDGTKLLLYRIGSEAYNKAIMDLDPS